MIKHSGKYGVRTRGVFVDSISFLLPCPWGPTPLALFFAFVQYLFYLYCIHIHSFWISKHFPCVPESRKRIHSPRSRKQKANSLSSFQKAESVHLLRSRKQKVFTFCVPESRKLIRSPGSRKQKVFTFCVPESRKCSPSAFQKAESVHLPCFRKQKVFTFCFPESRKCSSSAK